MDSVLYVESNYILGYAKGQDPFADRLLLSSETWPFRLAIPEICLMESLSAFKAEVKSRNNFLESLQFHRREAERDRTSGRAPSLELHLRGAITEAEYVLNDIEDRLNACLLSLVSYSEVFPLNPETIRRSLATPLLEDPNDNLILHAVIGHAQSRPPGPKAFFSGNRNDFGQPEAHKALESAGIRYFSRSDAATGWLSSQANLPEGAENQGDLGDRIG